MDWKEVAVQTATEGLDILTGALMELGINGFVIEDKKDFEAFLRDTIPYWDYVEESLMAKKDSATMIKFYLADNAQGNDTLQKVQTALEKLKTQFGEACMGPLLLSTVTVREEDWENNWKQYFKPIEIGEKFVIKPSWEEYHGQTDRIILEIDPSSSFGTGTHHTTQLCLEQIERHVKPGDHVLDMGCGSGILGIAALLLGAEDVLAVDIDENSVRIAKENTQKNKISPKKYKALCGNVISNEKLRAEVEEKQYDVILANIVADVIIGMSELFWNGLVSNGKLITSGIIGERAQEVKKALQAVGFTILGEYEKSDWICFTAQKKG